MIDNMLAADDSFLVDADRAIPEEVTEPLLLCFQINSPNGSLVFASPCVIIGFMCVGSHQAETYDEVELTSDGDMTEEQRQVDAITAASFTELLTVSLSILCVVSSSGTHMWYVSSHAGQRVCRLL